MYKIVDTENKIPDNESTPEKRRQNDPSIVWLLQSDPNSQCWQWQNFWFFTIILFFYQRLEWQFNDLNLCMLNKFIYWEIVMYIFILLN